MSETNQKDLETLLQEAGHPPLENEEDDPFDYRNVGTLQFIMLSRIYDILMLDLQGRNPEAAKQLLDLHSQGYILGPPPAMNGEFLTDVKEDDTGASA